MLMIFPINYDFMKLIHLDDETHKTLLIYYQKQNLHRKS